MSERIQLKEPGSEFALHVAKIGTETVEGSEYLLFSNNHTELLVPKSSVLGQLERLGVDAYTAIVGKTIKFSRSTKLSKYGKPYWNLDLASGAETSVGGNTPGALLAPAPSIETPSEKPRLDRLYLRATKLILDEVVPMYTKAGIGCSDGAVAAMVATVFIAASKVEAQ